MAGNSRVLWRAFNELKKKQDEPLQDGEERLVVLHKAGDDGDSLNEWTVFLAGPKGTPYEGGAYKALVKFLDSFPDTPPMVTFLSEICHPNVYNDGSVCVTTLSVCPEDEEEAFLYWHKDCSVEQALLSVVALLAEPNADDAANSDAVEAAEDEEGFAASCAALARRSLKEVPEELRPLLPSWICWEGVDEEPEPEVASPESAEGAATETVAVAADLREDGALEEAGAASEETSTSAGNAELATNASALRRETSTCSQSAKSDADTGANPQAEGGVAWFGSVCPFPDPVCLG